MKDVKRMTLDELEYAIRDCIEAAKAAWDLERASVRVLKTGGDYMDQAYAFQAEVSRRKNDTRLSDARQYIVELLVKSSREAINEAWQFTKATARAQATLKKNWETAETVGVRDLYITEMYRSLYSPDEWRMNEAGLVWQFE